MSGEKVGGIIMTIILGLITSYIFEIAKPHLPLLQPASPSARGLEDNHSEPAVPKSATQTLPSQAHTRPLYARIWLSLNDLGKAYDPALSSVIRCILFILVGSYAFVAFVQIVVQVVDKFSKFFGFMGDEVHVLLWPFVFCASAFLVYMWAALVASFLSVALWFLLVMWPFRFVVAKFKGDPPPDPPSFWSASPSFE
jgi:hypothetical protein